MTVKSTIEDAIRSKSTVKIILCLNRSLIKQFSPPICGIGPKTDEFLKQTSDTYGLEIIEYVGANACAEGYRKIMKYLYENSNSSKIVVFADDYIVPTGWFDRMQTNFTNHSEYDFIMPSTSFVWQKNLMKEVQYHPDWDVRVAPKGDHKKWNYKTIYGGVKIEHVDKMAKKFINNPLVPYSGSPSFETTVFRRKLIKNTGYIYFEYFRAFYDNDYFRMILQKGFKGAIGENVFIFHYGKGGNKALFSETADGKYKESPIINQYHSDIATWNRRWGESVKPWWGSIND